MGLDYSIRTYVKKEKISNSLNWLFENSWSNEKVPQKLLINGELFNINGDYFKIDDYQNKYLERNKVIEHFQKIYFTTSLVFEIEPKIIASLPGWELEYRMDLLEDFKEHFEQVYLGDGKIRIGGFDSTISKLTQQDVYEIDLTALTSDMSRLIEDSISVKKWILEFSKASDSLLTYLDLEHNGRRLVFYNGKEIDCTIKEGFDVDSYESVKNILNDYFTLGFNKKI